MKRKLLVALLMLTLIFTACSDNNTADNASDTPKSETPQSNESSDDKGWSSQYYDAEAM